MAPSKEPSPFQDSDMHEKVLSATLWVAYTNTDLTEGRGSDMPIDVAADLQRLLTRYPSR